MSTKTSVTPVPGTSSGTRTPVQQMRPTSPSLSPTRHSRLHEKAELQHLNDRLATYIDRVRNLENENSRLTVEVQTTRESVKRETSNIKLMYEQELGEARKLLDDVSKERAKLEIDTRRAFEEIDELKKKLDKKQKELFIAENSARVNEARYNEINGKFKVATADRKKAIDDAKELEKENDNLRNMMEKLRRQLEDETLARVDLENTVQSLREELTFKDQIHMQELNETRTHRQVEISEIDGRLSQQYEAKLQQSLQELREQYEAQMRSNREEIEMLYDAKIKNLQHAANRNSNAAASAIEELRVTRTRIDGLNARIGELEATNSALNARIRDLEKILDAERSRYADDIALLESELSRLRDEMAQQLQEYQDLMDIKVSLDLEIAAYDKLLKGEEHRLNITPSQNNTSDTVDSFGSSLRIGRATPVGRNTSVGRNTPSSRSQSALKRKRTMIDESEDRNVADYYVTGSAKGDIEISDADPEGRFVKLYNKGKKEITIGGWQLVRATGKNETLFKFHRSVKIDAGANVTVWSSDAGVDHEPPSNIVMKEKKWFIGDNMKTTLFNSDGEEVAAVERIKQQVSTHASRHRSSRGAGSENENLFMQHSANTTGTSSTSAGRSSFWLW